MLPPFLWPVRGTSAVAAVDAARQAERQADKNELDRLLYVALTRARDRLYIAGFEGTREAPADCWYHLVRQGLEERVEAKRGLGESRSVWRLESAQTVAPKATAQPSEPKRRHVQAPAWIGRRPAAAAERRRAAAALAAGAAEGGRGRRDGRAADPIRRAPSILSPHALLEEGRFLRGNLTHALLEHLPAVGRDRTAGGRGGLARQPRPRPRGIKIRAQIIAETLAVLEHPELAPLFGPDSRAEVPIVAALAQPQRRGASAAV